MGDRLEAAAADIDVRFRADRIGLFESVTGGGPARYEPLAMVRSGPDPGGPSRAGGPGGTIGPARRRLRARPARHQEARAERDRRAAPPARACAWRPEPRPRRCRAQLRDRRAVDDARDGHPGDTGHGLRLAVADVRRRARRSPRGAPSAARQPPDVHRPTRAAPRALPSRPDPTADSVGRAVADPDGPPTAAATPPPAHSDVVVVAHPTPTADPQADRSRPRPRPATPTPTPTPTPHRAPRRRWRRPDKPDPSRTSTTDPVGGPAARDRARARRTGRTGHRPDETVRARDEAPRRPSADHKRASQTRRRTRSRQPSLAIPPDRSHTIGESTSSSITTSVTTTIPAPPDGQRGPRPGDDEPHAVMAIGLQHGPPWRTRLASRPPARPCSRHDTGGVSHGAVGSPADQVRPR